MSDNEAPTLEELRARLHTKIEEARARRGAKPDGHSDAAGGKKTTTEGAKPEKHGKGKQPKEESQDPKEATGSRKRRRDAGNKAEGKKRARRAQDEPDEKKDELDFSTIKVSRDRTVGALSTPSKKPSKKALLHKAEKERKKLEALKQTPEGKSKADKATWDRLAQLAAGTKLHDDPALLRKSIRREQQRKRKSAKEWGKRTNAQARAQQDRAEARQQHIDERKRSKDGAAAPAAEGVAAKGGGRRQRRAGGGRRGEAGKAGEKRRKPDEDASAAPSAASSAGGKKGRPLQKGGKKK